MMAPPGSLHLHPHPPFPCALLRLLSQPGHAHDMARTYRTRSTTADGHDATPASRAVIHCPALGPRGLKTVAMGRIMQWHG